MKLSVLSKADRPFLFVLFLVVLLGLYNLASAGRNVREDFYLVQTLYVLLGLCLASAICFVDYRSFEGLATPFYTLALGLLVLTLFFGRVVNGSRRWLPMGPISLQTSDLAKLAVVFVMAKTLEAEKRRKAVLTLVEVFRPMNVSRPLVLALVVAVITVRGDALKPAEIQQQGATRPRTIAKLGPKRPALRVGRATTNDIVLSTGVDAEHAQFIRVDDGHYVVRDRNSASGTYVNGTKIEGDVRLHHGDTVRFGLNPRAELSFKAKLEWFRRWRVWAASISFVWLIAALGLLLKKGEIQTRDVVAPIDAVLPLCALIMVQPDLGTSLVVFLVALTMILYVGMRPSSLLGLGASLSVVGGIAWFLLLDLYQKERLRIFFNPSADLLGAGYHKHQSLIAMGSGGLTGKGHGQGTQTQLSFLPEQQTDFIFSVWGEEHGFLGSALVVVLFLALILLAFRLATLAKDAFGSLLAVGMTSILFWHAAINMLMVLGFMPIVGVPLPFFSAGGSFTLTSFVAVGAILNVGMRRFVF